MGDLPMHGVAEFPSDSGDAPVIEELVGRAFQSARRLADHLEEAIRSGRLQPSYRLPNERRLAQLAGLSRGTIRSALMDLERGGLIRRHVGRGTYVADPYVTDPQERPDPQDEDATTASPAHLLDFRMLFEPQLADYLVVRASDETLEEIARFVIESRSAATWRETESVDAEFHRLLCAASGNPLLVSAGHLMCLARAQPAWVRLKERRFDPRRWQRYQREHEEIIEALKARDAARARESLQGHLKGVRQRFAL